MELTPIHAIAFIIFVVLTCLVYIFLVKRTKSIRKAKKNLNKVPYKVEAQKPVVTEYDKLIAKPREGPHMREQEKTAIPVLTVLPVEPPTKAPAKRRGRPPKPTVKKT